MVEESVMRQGMKTWLKDECVSIGRPLFKISHLVNQLQDNLFLEDFMEARRTVDKIIYFGQVPQHLMPKLQSVVGNYENSIPDTPERESAIRDIVYLRANIENHTMEQVVECQVGKLGETGKFLRAYEITDPGDTVFSVGDTVPSEVFNAENVRVITLGKLPATGKPVMKKPDSSSSNPTEKGIGEPSLGIIGSTFDVAKGRMDWLYKNQFASFLLYRDSIDEAISDKEAGIIPKTETLKPFTLDELRSLKEYAGAFVSGNPEGIEPSTLKDKWYDKGVEAGKTDTWMDIENTIKETAERHPEIKDAADLIFEDVEQWKQTDHYTINYGRPMWDDVQDSEIYPEVEVLFWDGYVTGRKQISKDILGIAEELVKGR